MLSALVIAFLVYLRKADAPSLRGALSYLFPGSLYGHTSAIADDEIWIANSLVLTLVVAPTLVACADLASRAAAGVMAAGFGADGFGWHAGWSGQVLFTLAQLMAIDAAYFLAHCLQHRVPLLWEYHKVHHSAEVLIPVTVARMHPVDLILHFSIVGFTSAALLGTFSYGYAGPVAAFAVNGINVGIFLFYLAGVHLRHSHVWLTYPGWLGRHLSSPALHQIHHSAARRHADKDLGQILNIWDRMFGTLYLPEREEVIKYGLWYDEHTEFRSVQALYFRPFLKAARLLTPQPALSEPSPGRPEARNGNTR